MEQPSLAVARPHVLVVNDDQDVLDLLADLLREEGYRVTTSLFAFESPVEVAALRPDLIVADLRLGWTLDQGLSFLERLNRDALTTSIPVVICSASHPGVMEEASARLHGQARELVGKPFDVDDLLSAVARCVAQG